MPNSVAEQIKSFKYITDLCNLDKTNRDTLYNFYFKYAEEPTAVTLINTVNGFILAMKEFEDCLKMSNKTAYDLYLAQSRPLIVSHKGAIATLKVYPNIILDKGVTHSSLSNLSITDILNCFSEFFKEYENAKANDPHFEQKWGPERTTKRLTQEIEVGTATALTRYLDMRTFKDNQIRDLAQQIDIARKPIALIYCETPEDYATMYKSGPTSCMAQSGGGTASWRFLTAKGLAPASFYYYFPYTKGAYIQQRGVVAARAILWKISKDNVKEVWQYGRVYASNEDMRQKFVKALHDAGIMSMTAKLTPSEGFTMKLPGFHMEENGMNDYGAPFPYFDNMDYYGKGFTATFDDKAKEFTLVYNTNDRGGSLRGLIPISGRGGHIRAADYKIRKCESCGRNTHDREGVWLTTADGHMFCGEHCAIKNNYRRVFDGNGGYAYHINDPAFIHAPDGMIFTNLAAAYLNGYHPKLPALGIIPEEHGTAIIGTGDRTVDPADGDTYYRAGDHGSYRFTYINKVPCSYKDTKASAMTFNTADSLVEEVPVAA